MEQTIKNANLKRSGPLQKSLQTSLLVNTGESHIDFHINCKSYRLSHQLHLLLYGGVREIFTGPAASLWQRLPLHHSCCTSPMQFSLQLQIGEYKAQSHERSGNRCAGFHAKITNEDAKKPLDSGGCRDWWEGRSS